jgi:hypothetical protein
MNGLNVVDSSSVSSLKMDVKYVFQTIPRLKVCLYIGDIGWCLNVYIDIV